MDKIIVQDLLVRGFIGVTPEEREHRQDILINFTLFCDISSAAASDDFSNAIDYSALKRRLVEFTESTTFNLLEALAERLTEIILSDRRIRRVRLRADKPQALSYARKVGIEIVRRQSKSSSE